MKSLIEKYNKQLNSLNKDSDNYLDFKKEIIYKYRENLEFYILNNFKDLTKEELDLIETIPEELNKRLSYKTLYILKLNKKRLINS
jgi:hypothetical protein